MQMPYIRMFAADPVRNSYVCYKEFISNPRKRPGRFLFRTG